MVEVASTVDRLILRSVIGMLVAPIPELQSFGSSRCLPHHEQARFVHTKLYRHILDFHKQMRQFVTCYLV